MAACYCLARMRESVQCDRFASRPEQRRFQYQLHSQTGSHSQVVRERARTMQPVLLRSWQHPQNPKECDSGARQTLRAPIRTVRSDPICPVFLIGESTLPRPVETAISTSFWPDAGPTARRKWLSYCTVPIGACQCDSLFTRQARDPNQFAEG